MNLEYIISKNVFDINDIVAIYPYGSRVYGIAQKISDYDYIVITNNKKNNQYSDNLININFYTPEEHQARLDDHEISALECHFLPKEQILFGSNKSFNFKLDTIKLRHSLCAKSSNSWVKAKKKLTVEKDLDLNLGRKSLFHAIRIIEYGIQITETGRIVDYGGSNLTFSEIQYCYTWGELHMRYKKTYNKLLSKFRTLAPKIK